MPDFNELVKNLYTSKDRELTEDKLSYIEKTYKGKEEDFVKNFYATIGEELPEEKFNYIRDTYLKKKDFQGFSQELPKPTMPSGEKFTQGIGLGVKPISSTVSPSVSKPPKSTIPFASTGVKTNLDYLRDINSLYKEKINTSQQRINAKRELLALQPEIEDAYSKIESLSSIYNDENLSPQERNDAAKAYNALVTEFQPMKSKYDNLVLSYNDLVKKDKQEVTRLKEIDNQRQLQLQKEFNLSKDLLEKTGKGFVDAAAGISGIFNTLGLSGDPESPEIQEEVKEQTRQNIEKIRSFGNSLVTQETPKEWQSIFEGKFSPKKLAYVTSQAVSSTIPTVAAGLFTGGAGTALAGAGMGFNESKDILKEAGLNDSQAEWASLGLSIPLGLLEEYGAGDIVKILSSPVIKKKVANELVKNLAGKKITKELLFVESKKSLGKVIKENAGGILNTGYKESMTEMGQGTLQEIAKQTAQEYTGVDPDQEIPFSEYAKSFAMQRAEEGVGGFLGGTTLAATGKGVELGLSRFQTNFTPTVYSQAIEFRDPEKLQEFQEDLEGDIAEGLITPEQAQEALQNVQAIVEADNLIPNNIIDNDIRTKAVNLIIEKNNIERDIEGKDKSLVTPLSERVKEIDEQLVAISKGEKIEEKALEEITDVESKIEEPIKTDESGISQEATPKGDTELEVTEPVIEEGKEQVEIEETPTKEEITPEQIETGRQEVSAVKEGKIETANPIRLFKGLFGKRNLDGTHKSAHPNAKGVFSAVDEKVAERYKGEDGMGTFDIPAGTTMEVIRLAVRNVPMSKFREQETEAINASDAQIVKLITTDAKGAEEQYVIKDPALIEKMQKPEDVKQTKEQEDAVQEQTAGQVPVQPEAKVSEGVEGGKPKAEPKEATEESKGEEVEKQIDAIFNPDFKNTIVDKLSKFDKQIADKKFPSALEVAEHVLPRSIFNKYKKLYELAARNNITVSNERLPSGATAAWAFNNIQLNKNIAKYYLSDYNEFAETLNHEIIHGLISRGIRDNYALNNDLKDVMSQVLDRFDSASDEVKNIISYIQDTSKEFREKDYYGATNEELESDKLKEVGSLEELITYAFTNKEFADFLDSIPASKKINVKGESIFQQLKNVIRDFISKKLKNATALDEINSVIDKYFDTSWNEEQIAERNEKYEWGLRFSANESIFDKYNNDPKLILEAYYKRNNPKLNKAVNELLGIKEQVDEVKVENSKKAFEALLKEESASPTAKKKASELKKEAGDKAVKEAAEIMENIDSIRQQLLDAGVIKSINCKWG